MTKTIVTTYSTRTPEGFIRYSKPRDYGEVTAEILNVMATVFDDEGTPGDQLFEWLTQEAEVNDWDKDFPPGDCWVTVSTGNSEGYILRVLTNDAGAIQSRLFFKFLNDRAMVEKLQIAVQRAFDNGLFDYRLESDSHDSVFAYE